MYIFRDLVLTPSLKMQKEDVTVKDLVDIVVQASSFLASYVVTNSLYPEYHSEQTVRIGNVRFVVDKSDRFVSIKGVCIRDGKKFFVLDNWIPVSLHELNSIWLNYIYANIQLFINGSQRNILMSQNERSNIVSKTRLC